MPNHIHAIITITRAPKINVGATLAVARNGIAVAQTKRAMPITKRATTRVAPTDQLTMDHPWINDQKTNKTNCYIKNNPIKWQNDNYYV